MIHAYMLHSCIVYTYMYTGVVRNLDSPQEVDLFSRGGMPPITHSVDVQRVPPKPKILYETLHDVCHLGLNMDPACVCVCAITKLCCEHAIMQASEWGISLLAYVEKPYPHMCFFFREKTLRGLGS